MNTRPLDLSLPDDALWMALAQGDAAAAEQALADGALPAARRPAEWDDGALAAYGAALRARRCFYRPTPDASALEAAAHWRQAAVVERMLSLEAAPSSSEARGRTLKALEMALMGQLPYRGQKEEAAKQDRVADALLSALPLPPWEPEKDASPQPAAPTPTGWTDQLLNTMRRLGGGDADRNWVSWRWLRDRGALEEAAPRSSHPFAAGLDPQIAAIAAQSWPSQGLEKLRKLRASQAEEDASDAWCSQSRAKISGHSIELIERLLSAPDDVELWFKTPVLRQMVESSALSIATGDGESAAKKMRALAKRSPEQALLNARAVFSFLWEQGGPSGLASGAQMEAGWRLAAQGCSGSPVGGWLPIKGEAAQEFGKKTQTDFWRLAFFNFRMNPGQDSKTKPLAQGREALRSGAWSPLWFWAGLSQHSQYHEQKVAWREARLLEAREGASTGQETARFERARQEAYETQDLAFAASALKFLGKTLEKGAVGDARARPEAMALKFAEKGNWFALEALFSSGLVADENSAAVGCFLAALRAGRAIAAEKTLERATPQLTGMLRSPDGALKVKAALEEGRAAHQELLTGKSKSGKSIAASAMGAHVQHSGQWSRVAALVEALDIAADLDALRGKSALALGASDAKAENGAQEKARRL